MRSFALPKLMSLSDAAPVSEGMAAVPGSGAQASRDDHRHPRLTSSTAHVTAANGEATVAFTRVFTAKPGLAIVPEEDADNGALTWKSRSWTRDAQNNYTGCVIKFYRIQPLPAVLTLLTALISFRVDLGTVGAIPFTCIALERSS